MFRTISENTLRFFVLTFLQVAVLNHVQLGGYINPYLYILFILILPFETPKWLLLVLGFILGLTIDLFMQSPGLHAASCVLMAFLRPFVAATISSKREYEPGIRPSVQDLGFSWFVTYAGILTVAHHTVLFFTEVFHFGEFGITVQRILYSSVITVIVLVLSQYIFYRPPRNIISGKI